MHKTLRLFYTVKELKLIQIYYQIYYRIKKKIWKQTAYKECFKSEVVSLELKSCIPNPQSFNDHSFTFLNLTKDFETNQINWNEKEFGKLWCYNLNYFDFLNQSAMDEKQGSALIDDFVHNFSSIVDGMEPYPISLRGINWIKFITEKSIKNNEWNNCLFSQYQYLINNIEYHILGNHLLENGFSLLWASYYFNNERFYRKACKILRSELQEQILNDGAHFELSTMYHQIILLRLLDSINLIQANHVFHDDLLNHLTDKARLMLSYINEITFENGQIPFLNDSISGIAPSTNELNEYALRLGIDNCYSIKLKDSGYRKIATNSYEIIMDIGKIGPSYIPGHGHSDTFNFLLYSKSKIIISDPGISTYEKNSLRTLERSTDYHNTVKINSINQSDVWGGFRVGKRAEIIDLKETDCSIVASHNGYRNKRIIHTRKFNWGPNQLYIYDSITGEEIEIIESFLHFAPGITPVLKEDGNIIVENLRIEFSGILELSLESYRCPIGYNKYVDSIKARMSCDRESDISIKIMN